MKSVILFALFVAVAVAAPLESDKTAVVVKNYLDNLGVDGFESAYETSNGIAAQSQGKLINPGTENEGVAIRGQYSYVGPDGVNYVITYIADDKGFQPSGDHLPKAF